MSLSSLHLCKDIFIILYILFSYIFRRISGEQLNIENLKNRNFDEKDSKISIFLFRLSERTLEIVLLNLYFISSKWLKNMREVCDKVMKNIYLKACNENKYRVRKNLIVMLIYKNLLIRLYICTSVSKIFQMMILKIYKQNHFFINFTKYHYPGN